MCPNCFHEQQGKCEYFADGWRFDLAVFDGEFVDEDRQGASGRTVLGWCHRPLRTTDIRARYQGVWSDGNVVDVVNVERRSGLRIALIAVMVLGAVGGAGGLGWYAIDSFDRGMSVHTYESIDDARRLARSLGLAIVDGDHIDYGEYTSAFQDPGAYLVIVASSPERLAQIVQNSGLHAPTEVHADLSLRSPEHHGPPRTSTLVTSTVERHGNFLTAYWDPVAAPRRLFVSAYET